MAYWLLKSEPSNWSWQNQCAVDKEPWDGVRNYQARNHMRAMASGDLAFFYHSVNEKRIVGVVRVVTEAYPDPSDDTGKWQCVDVSAVTAIANPVTLADMKSDPALINCALFKQSRLSVVPIMDAEWRRICEMGDVPDLNTRINPKLRG